MRASKIKLYRRYNVASMLTALITGAIFLVLSGTQTLAAITRGYSTDDTALSAGMVVALSQNSTPENPKIERASKDQIERVIGIATTVNESLVTLSSGDQAAYVESEGEINAFVVSINDEVKQGDLLTLSAIRGVLTKALPQQPIIAIALEDFSAETADTYSIQDGDTIRDVPVQRLRVNLDRQASASLNSKDDSALTELGRSIIGKDVGALQVVAALVIFFIVLVAEGTILYGAISGAISSLGRNPLAKNIIRHELIRVLFVALTVLVIGLAAIYAVLWV